MSIIRSASTRQYLKSVREMNARKAQGTAQDFPYFISSSLPRIQSCSRYHSLSVHNGGSQTPETPVLVQHRTLNSYQKSHLATWHHISVSYPAPWHHISTSHPATWHHISTSHPATWHHISASYPDTSEHISASHLATWHHISASSYSGTSQLGHPGNTTNRSLHSEDTFNRKSHGYSQTREKVDSNLIKYLSHLLTGVGLSYIIYRVLTYVHEQSDILPVASCSSQETQGTKLQGQETQKFDSSSQKSRKKSKKAKRSTGTSGNQRISLQAAVERAQKICRRRKEEVGSPGMVVCVSVDGKQVYAEGIGYSNLENEIPMKPSSVLRIASISKAVTATIVAKAWEEGHIDLEKSVQHYVPSFPQKEFMGEKVEITVQQLLSHTSGIRHYKSKDDPVYAFDKPIADLVGLVKNASWQPFYKTGPLVEKATTQESEGEKQQERGKTQKKEEVSEMERDEYYLTKHFSTTEEALALFSKDPLIARPGTRYLYTTFAYTLLAAVVEAALKSPFTNVVTKTLVQLGLSETYLDLNQPLIYNRAQYYVKDAKGNTVNAPYVDNSYKWAGGGLLSTSEDMVKFGNILLYSAQHKDEDSGPPGFLKASTMWKFWSSQGKEGTRSTYGLGFEIRPASELFGMTEHRGFGAGHTGAAVGASSALFILPRQSLPGMHATIKNSISEVNISKVAKSALRGDKNTSDSVKTSCEPISSSINITEDTSCVVDKNLCERMNQSVAGQLPQGVVVCIILNMISVSARDIAEDIARTFEKVDFTL